MILHLLHSENTTGGRVNVGHFSVNFHHASQTHTVRNAADNQIGD